MQRGTQGLLQRERESGETTYVSNLVQILKNLRKHKQH